MKHLTGAQSGAHGRAGWLFREAAARDIDQLMRWFDDLRSTQTWGGPEFRFPFTRHSFTEDMHWGRMPSYSLCDAHDALAAFGQLYERFGRINLARLVVDPARRRQGLGRQLIRRLLVEGSQAFDCDEYSLFVYRDNLTALACYEGEGFRITDYPDGMPLADECFYLTRPVARRQTES